MLRYEGRHFRLRQGLHLGQIVPSAVLGAAELAIPGAPALFSDPRSGSTAGPVLAEIVPQLMWVGAALMYLLIARLFRCGRFADRPGLRGTYLWPVARFKRVIVGIVFGVRGACVSGAEAILVLGIASRFAPIGMEAFLVLFYVLLGPLALIHLCVWYYTTRDQEPVEWVD